MQMIQLVMQKTPEKSTVLEKNARESTYTYEGNPVGRKKKNPSETKFVMFSTQTFYEKFTRHNHLQIMGQELWEWIGSLKRLAWKWSPSMIQSIFRRKIIYGLLLLINPCEGTKNKELDNLSQTDICHEDLLSKTGQKSL